MPGMIQGSLWSRGLAMKSITYASISPLGQKQQTLLHDSQITSQRSRELRNERKPTLNTELSDHYITSLVYTSTTMSVPHILYL